MPVSGPLRYFCIALVLLIIVLIQNFILSQNVTIIETDHSAINTKSHENTEGKSKPIQGWIRITDSTPPLRIPKTKVWKANKIGSDRSSPPSFEWCIENDIGERTRGINPVGFLYIKIEKAASSTVAGVALRIATEVGKRSLESQNKCYARWVHGFVSDTAGTQKRIKDKAFLWTVIREPSKRAMSEAFHFQVSRKGVQPTDDNIVRELKKQWGIFDGTGGFHTRYLSERSIDKNSVWSSSARKSIKNVTLVEELVEDILNDFDFIGVVERLDESLVALRLILGLDATDILYLSAKTSGGYDDGRYKNESGHELCVKIRKSFVSEGVEKFLASEEWRTHNAADFLLYAAVNQSLDRTIERLGKYRFEEALTEHRLLLKSVESKCAASAVFPCSADGKLQHNESAQNCYWDDSGCGYPCIDQLTKQ